MDSLRRGTARSATGVLIGSILGAAVTAGALTFQGHAVDEETRRAVTAVKQGIVAGHKAKDRAALDRLYASDYTATDAKGTVRTKADLLAGLPTDAEMTDGRYEILAVRRWGNIAVATGHGHLVYRNPDGSTRTSDYYSFNVFEHRDGRWSYAAAFLP